jgi:signal peptidase II
MAPLWTAIVAVVVVIVDQLSKVAVRDSLIPGETLNILPGLQIVDARNPGVSFGLLAGRDFAVNALIGFALLTLVIYFACNRAKPFIWLPTGLLLGGAFGNLFDRIRVGGVTDFVRLPLGWPIFNLADVSITFGVLLLLLLIERPAYSSPMNQRIEVNRERIAKAMRAPSKAKRRMQNRKPRN